MTTFSFSVQSTCFGVLALLLCYTLWLMRSGQLSAHVTVRWVLAESAAFLAVLLWRWLPMFSYTSRLGDRELLVVLAVIFFSLIGFLILDCLVRISTHTRQIKLLAQELALLRECTEPDYVRSEQGYPHCNPARSRSQADPLTKGNQSS